MVQLKSKGQREAENGNAELGYDSFGARIHK